MHFFFPFVLISSSCVVMTAQAFCCDIFSYFRTTVCYMHFIFLLCHLFFSFFFFLDDDSDSYPNYGRHSYIEDGKCANVMVLYNKPLAVQCYITDCHQVAMLYAWNKNSFLNGLSSNDMLCPYALSGYMHIIGVGSLAVWGL